MVRKKSPSLTKGAIWLALRLLRLHGLTSLVICIPAIAALVICGLVLKSGAILYVLYKSGLPPTLAIRIESSLVYGLIAALLVLIAIIALRGIIISAAGNRPTVDVETSSIAHPTLVFAFKRSWLVLVIVGAVYLAVHTAGGAVAHSGPKALITIGLSLALTLVSIIAQPTLLILLGLLLGLFYGLGRIALHLFNETLIHFGAEQAARIDVQAVAKEK